mmetsp:Transcript_109289/g.348733  ORF Transcript_109289/g.348733 Transcript_109289/m.348733 type:complete len:201 (-) Transcript_109289:308-910(-)
MVHSLRPHRRRGHASARRRAWQVCHQQFLVRPADLRPLCDFGSRGGKMPRLQGAHVLLGQDMHPPDRHGAQEARRSKVGCLPSQVRGHGHHLQRRLPAQALDRLRGGLFPLRQAAGASLSRALVPAPVRALGLPLLVRPEYRLLCTSLPGHLHGRGLQRDVRRGDVALHVRRHLLPLPWARAQANGDAGAELQRAGHHVL